MTIGIDIDGTLTAFPDFFLEMTKLFRSSGHRVILITGLGKNGWPPKLAKRGWSPGLFDGIYDTSLYNREEIALIGREHDNERIVGRFKQRICREQGVDVMFDDQAFVHRQFGSAVIFQVPTASP